MVRDLSHLCEVLATLHEVNSRRFLHSILILIKVDIVDGYVEVVSIIALPLEGRSLIG